MCMHAGGRALRPRAKALRESKESLQRKSDTRMSVTWRRPSQARQLPSQGVQASLCVGFSRIAGTAGAQGMCRMARARDVARMCAALLVKRESIFAEFQLIKSPFCFTFKQKEPRPPFGCCL